MSWRLFSPSSSSSLALALFGRSGKTKTVQKSRFQTHVKLLRAENVKQRLPDARAAKRHCQGCVPKTLFAVRARSNRAGQTLAPKALAYLILVLIVIVAAIMFLSRVYNALIGGPPEKQDAELLANTINDMIADDRKYMQVPILLRLEDKLIIGFDDMQTSISSNSINYVGSQGGLSKTNVGVQYEPINCDSQTCVCSADDKKVRNCYIIKTSNNKISSVRLATNYYPFSNPLKELQNYASGLDIPANMPKEQQGTYTQFMIDRDNIQILKIVDKAKTKYVSSKPKTDVEVIPILPLIIEKITGDTGVVSITVMPDTNRMRAREAYMYECPPNTDSENTGNCDAPGKNTFVTSMSQDKKTACGASVFSPQCTRNQINKCIDNELVTAPCYCGAEIALYGVCFNGNQQRDIQCEVVQSCEEYCKLDGEYYCEESDLQAFCAYDPCNIAGNGQKCITIPAPTVTNRIKSIFSTTYKESRFECGTSVS